MAGVAALQQLVCVSEMNETSGKSLNIASAQNVATGSDFVLNLTELLDLLRRKAWIIVLSAMLCGLFATYSVLQVTPTFTATAQILLGQQSRADDALGNLFEGLDLDSSQIAGQIAIMESGRILLRVSEKLELSRLPEFNYELREKSDGPSIVDRVVDAAQHGFEPVFGA
ncbi:MAG: Wzz/FepE/Etk N-terminal domain-containing protein, partial [Pseudomonadota bacterium]